MRFDIRVLRWIACLGLASVLLHDLFASFPLKARQGYGSVLLAIEIAVVALASLVLMPRALGTLARRANLLLPLALVTFAEKLLAWLSGVPGFGAVLNPSFPLHILGLGLGISLHFLLNIALGVGYAAWMTAAVLELVRSARADPCEAIPSAARRFWRVLGLEFIGWAVVFLGVSVLLLLMPAMGAIVLAPMLVFAVGWNFATAALLPMAWDNEPGFWMSFRTGVRASLANVHKWWLLLLAQMLLLGLFNFFHSNWSEGGTHHTDMSWNVNAFWTGGYEAECRWYSKMVEVYHTSKVPIVETALALLFGAMAVGIKIAIVQRMQPESQSAPPPTLDASPAAVEPPVHHPNVRLLRPRDLASDSVLPALLRTRRKAALACLAVTLLAVRLADAADDWVTVRPQDIGEALVNPGMGWTLHFYSNFIENYGSKLAPSDTLDDWPGLSVIYLRVPWSFLEPKEGEFNWSLFDTPAQRWIANGKKIAIRVSCSESWWRYATPKWVQDAGAKGVDFEFGKGPKPGGPLWDPDYLDPVFLEKLDHFLGAMARRYDGNPNVAFIDIGSFGMWGEGHTGGSSRLNEEQTLAVVKKHIDLHVKHFPRTLLCISDDVAGPSRPGRHFPEMDYALSKGVTMRDDSILVQPPPRSWYHAEMAQEFWPRLPVILEHEHYGGSKARKAWSGDLLLKSVEDYHASYMSIHWWPREELEENRETVARLNRRLGYRIQLKEIRWPAAVKLGEPFVMETAWANAGVAPCYGGGFWAFTLKDEKGGIVSAQVDESFDLKTLKVGPPDQAPVEKVQSRFTIAFRHAEPHGTHAPPTKPGTCDVFVSVGQRDGTPRIALPLPLPDGQGRYRIGRIELK